MGDDSLKVLVACKRGNIAQRDKWGHCLCQKCKDHNKSIREKTDRSEYQKEWRKQNKEKIRQYTKKWSDNNTERRKETIMFWRYRNPDKVKAMNSRGGRKWSKNNRGKRNAITSKRRSALLHRIPEWSDLNKIKQIYLQAEIISNDTGIPHEVDHIIPLQGVLVSGLHVIGNLQIIPMNLNRSKKNKMEELSYVYL